MVEELITFETAKLAKEKGFCIELYDFYYQSKSNAKPYITQGIEYQSDKNCKWDWNLNGGESGMLTKIIPYPNDESGIYYSAPTQSLLQKWLREVHNIHVSIVEGFQDGKIYYEAWVNIFKNKKFEEQHFDLEMYSDKYEETLEIGIQEALKLIEIVNNK
jgi:hypothetical protein